MSEDFDRIVDWVEFGPLDYFSSLSGEGDQALMALDDLEARAACNGIRTYRAQLVVDKIYLILKEREGQANQEISEVEAKIKALDAQYLIDRTSLNQRLEDVGNVAAAISQAITPGDVQDRQVNDSSRETLNPNAHRIVEIIERGGEPDVKEIAELFEQLGPFKISLSTTPNQGDMNLASWLERYKIETDYAPGLDRGKKIVAMDRAAGRFAKQTAVWHRDGNGFVFIKNLSPEVVEIETATLNGVKVVSSFTVLQPEVFLKKAMKDSQNGGLSKAGLKTLLGLRLIAEIQKTDKEDEVSHTL